MASQKHSTITPDAFTVAPHLLGLPLAAPSRRALAMGIDLLLVAMLIRAGGFLLGVAAAFVLWRFSIWSGSGGFLKQGVRLAFRVTAAIVAFLVISKAWGSFQDSRNNDDENLPAAIARETGNIDFNLSGLDLSTSESVKLMTLTAGLGDVHDEDDARARADSIAALLRRAGADSARLMKLRSVALLVARADENDAAHAAIDSAFGVPARADVLQEQQDQIELLKGENRRLRSENENRKEAHGVRAVMSSAADDLGLGFGWMAVYFTACLALMGGRTPGKRLVGIRVVRLDAKPISYWIAFERFGGYAASATMGLLGFMQILWDRNRQGFHDKAVDTVVIREVRLPAANDQRPPHRYAQHPPPSASTSSRPQAQP